MMRPHPVAFRAFAVAIVVLQLALRALGAGIEARAIAAGQPWSNWGHIESEGARHSPLHTHDCPLGSSLTSGFIVARALTPAFDERASHTAPQRSQPLRADRGCRILPPARGPPIA
ncbi:MAG TPA: hypothetical protein VJ803_09110 [Gemmatimonadaceae bacterium]|nr:hypothetical protein [Gemmatimonadaceae bacterium]